MTTTTRPDRGLWLMTMAYVVAMRGTCPRRKVGALLVRNGRPIAEGYVGSAPREPHCEDVGCLLDTDGHCQRTIHAEVNALAEAARRGASTGGATLISTDFPCPQCLKLLASAGINQIIYNRKYRGEPQTTDPRYGISVSRQAPMAPDQLLEHYLRALEAPVAEPGDIYAPL